MSLKDKIFEANDLVLIEREVPEWNVTGYLRPLTAEQMNKVQHWGKLQRQGKRQNSESIAGIVVLGFVDESGEPIFESGDTNKLATKSYAVLDQLSNEILELSGIELKVEDAEKN